jgi:CelD/BcsL family acetyltransferase involved in cellulose biosynthesis
MVLKVQPLSAHIETADMIYIIANSYDEKWKAFSRGSILSFEILTDGCRRGKTRIDWGQGDSGYKSRWGARCGTKSLIQVMFFRPGLLGKFLACVASYRFSVNKGG